MIMVANIIAGKNPIVDDSIIKNFEGWRLNKRITSQVPIKPTLRATMKGMIYHVKACLQDTSAPKTIILHLGTNMEILDERLEKEKYSRTNSR